MNPYRRPVLRHSVVGIEYLLSYGNPGNLPGETADGKGGLGRGRPRRCRAESSGIQ